MQIRIQQQGVALAPDLVGHIEERVLFALARFNGDIRSVVVRLTGQVKPQCEVEVRTTWGKPILVEEADRDIYTAVTRAIERAGRAADRHTAANAVKI
jgi:ribosome-associated translation inhibitor RaiA